MPFVEAFALGEVGVENGDLVLQAGEAGFEVLDSLRGERDLGDENEDGAAVIEGVLGGLEVDFSFSGAGDAVEEDGFWEFGVFVGVGVGIDRFADDVVGSGLSGVEFEGFTFEEFLSSFGIAADGFGFHFDVAGFLECLDRGPDGATAKVGEGDGAFCGEEGEDGVLAGGAFGELFECLIVGHLFEVGDEFGFRAVRLLPDGVGDEGAHDEFEGSAVVAGHPARELDEVGGDQWQGVDEGGDGLQFEAFHFGFADGEDGAGGVAALEGDLNAASRQGGHAIGNCVVKDELGWPVDEYFSCLRHGGIEAQWGGRARRIFEEGEIFWPGIFCREMARGS